MIFKSKLGAKLLKPFSSHITQPEALSLCQKKRLVMTILVKNEVDIIVNAIEHHLKSGVDHIFVTDNMSTDGTYELLEVLAKQNKIELMREPGQTHSQAKWVNRMGELAFQKFKPDYIVHADADEFWVPKSGNLKYELTLYPLVRALNVDVKNVLLRFNDFKEHFPLDSQYVVDNPIISSNLQKDAENTPLFYMNYPPKIIYKLNQGYIKVSDGNHKIEDGKKYVTKESQDISIYHFPVRSKKQFFNRVINGGKALENNKEKNKNYCWHWRKWYAQYNAGTLEDEYKNYSLTPEAAEPWIHKGILNKRNLFGNEIKIDD